MCSEANLRSGGHNDSFDTTNEELGSPDQDVTNLPDESGKSGDEPSNDEVGKSAVSKEEHDEDLLNELAQLAPLEYDKVREQTADRVGISVATLDAEVEKRRPTTSRKKRQLGRDLSLKDTKPWDQEVNGCELLDEITARLKSHLSLSEGAAEAIALWSVMTHAFGMFEANPRLALLSPEKRCGKTTAFDALSNLCRRPLSASNITPAAIFRSIEMSQPTLIMDEADTYLTNQSDMRGILNSGFNKSSAYVVRSVGEEYEPRSFSTWSPVAIAMIGEVPHTLSDRSIIIPLHRKHPSEAVEEIRSEDRKALMELARKAARWVRDNIQELKEARPDCPPGFHDRQKDAWSPLFAIADVASDHWPETARRAANALIASLPADDDAVRIQLLRDIEFLFDIDGSTKASSSDLCARLSALEGRPWCDWGRPGREISQLELAKLLRMFGIRPKAIRFGKSILQGYERAAFEDAFARYLPSKSRNTTTS